MSLSDFQTKIDDKMLEAEEILAKSIEVQDLACSIASFFIISRLLYSRIPKLNPSITLQELTLDNLPSDLVFPNNKWILSFG